MCIAKLCLHVVVFWFLCSQVVLAGGKYVLWRNFGCGCKGHLYGGPGLPLKILQFFIRLDLKLRKK